MLHSGWLQVLRLLEPFGAVKDLQLFMGKARAKGTPTVRGSEGCCEVFVKERGCERGVRGLKLPTPLGGLSAHQVATDCQVCLCCGGRWRVAGQGQRRAGISNLGAATCMSGSVALLVATP